MALRFNLLNRTSYKIAFIDIEATANGKKITDYGALKDSGAEFHASSKSDFFKFVDGAEYLCGHNIVHHDLKILAANSLNRKNKIDTLYLSPLLFPKKPYHNLLKDDKLQSDDLNNPLNDCKKAQTLFFDEINAFNSLPYPLKQIYANLLISFDEFKGFFHFVEFVVEEIDTAAQIHSFFEGKICKHAELSQFIQTKPMELAYALALINTNDVSSVTPPWLLHNYPAIEHIIRQLCNTPCFNPDCLFCTDKLNIHKGLEDIFGYQEFRTFDGEPMQERAVQAAINGDSLLTVFPTGGGKSLTFQLPAIMSGRAVHGLTVVISPLQSLMKDQVDNLLERGITDAVTINGLLDPISRADAFERVANGTATMLYISPEMLRSKTIEKMLLSRNVVRFVIDEAHCFSSWGQDFRVDYLYIGDFIRQLQEKKRLETPIPVSCFTATAKQKVISDIYDYFKRKLNIELKIFASTSTRKNLKYAVIHAETEEEKYNYMRNLMIANPEPTIIYVSRTQKAVDLANKLSMDGFQALPYHGKMDSNDKIAAQNKFINNVVRVMVATSAFGMGVDKKDVGMVIHYDISASLEDYVQEAGRAGRNPEMEAKCYVLYSDHDLDKHFILLNQTKLSISEIQQVWKAVKDLTKQFKTVQCSALEIARQAGWNDDVPDIETRVRTAISALEQAGYLSRGSNVPHVFATGITVKNMDEARLRIENSELFDENDRQNAIRIIKSLISSKHIAKATTADGEDAESRVDYLADILGMSKAEVINAVNIMRQDGILADTRDMIAHLLQTDNERKTWSTVEKFALLEHYLLRRFAQNDSESTYKTINEEANADGIHSTVKDIHTVLNFLSMKSYINKREHNNSNSVQVLLKREPNQLLSKLETRIDLCRFIVNKLFQLQKEQSQSSSPESQISFSLTELLKEYIEQPRDLLSQTQNIHIKDMEEALLYMSKIGALKLEGGFLVIYNAMLIHRKSEMKYRYKVDDYRMLDEFYKQKIRQIHIVGEYANLMVKDYAAALQYVQDYFQMDFKKFISTYFKGDRAVEIEKNITPAKYRQLFGELSETQRKIITDKNSKHIVVAAGPGSGKTRVLVHKLASLLLLEDVKHEQLLMLTFSRAAATEFKQRLIDLIGNAAYFVEIKTFHSYSFDLLGENGSLENSDDVVERATQMIENEQVEPGRISKTVLVIDEAQDMDIHEYSLVRALMKQNEEMRVIAVGDDDQNIFSFRGSDAKYMRMMINELGAVKYELTDNYRSDQTIVSFAEDFVKRLPDRMKSNVCTSVNKQPGQVEITEYLNDNLLFPLVRDIKCTYHGKRACVLTNTNDEAAQTAGLLNKMGLRARLIQSAEGFRFYNLMEIRYFLKKIKQQLASPIISDDLWQLAKSKTLTKYKYSACLNYIQNFFIAFETTHKEKYFTDLNEFLFESKLEDFCGEDNEVIFVSTIHKAKGREFDSVYMLLNHEEASTEESVRKLYVGITRAKHNLHIHCNTPIFQNSIQRAQYKHDMNLYPEPDEIVLQLSMRDVNLGFFKEIKQHILQLHSGIPLYYDNGFLRDSAGNRVVHLSKSKREELKHWLEKGYSVTEARVSYIVAWKGEEEGEECAVILPDLVLKK